jgi:hypothetical protein
MCHTLSVSYVFYVFTFLSVSSLLDIIFKSQYTHSIVHPFINRWWSIVFEGLCLVSIVFQCIVYSPAYRYAITLPYIQIRCPPLSVLHYLNDFTPSNA